MKKVNVFELVKFGEDVAALSQLPNTATKLNSVASVLYSAKVALQKQLALDSILLPASRRATSELSTAINQIVPGDDPISVYKANQEQKIESYSFYYVRQALEKLNAVLAADMPGIASYVVAQKGIYRTEDLIDNARKHLQIGSEPIPEQARLDIDAAGRCLAFELSTASAFHMWRAVEDYMCLYYQQLTGRAVSDDKVQRSWAAYIAALKKASAAPRITDFLDHIRREYRNPVAHPDVNIETSEALNLFSTGCSVIGQIATEISKLKADAGQQS